jgi:hypothetical protein
MQNYWISLYRVSGLMQKGLMQCDKARKIILDELLISFEPNRILAGDT